MKLKERWEKQNNSVKLLLRKLRRHDTFVVAVAVMIALVLCGGLIYMSTPVVAASARDQVVQSENENNEKTTEKLDELHNCLTDLDEMIVKNQKGIDSYYEKTKNERLSDAKNANDVNEKVSGLGTNLKNIHSSVNSTESRIESLKELIESGNGETRDKAAKEFDAINKELSNIQAEYENLKKHNKELMDDLDEEIRREVKDGDDKITNDTSARYSELFDKLAKFDEELEKRNIESVSDLKNEFESLSKSLGDRIDEKIDDYNSENKAMGDRINENIENFNSESKTRGDEINKKIENYNSESQARGDKLNEKIENINTEIVADMAGLKGYIDEKTIGINSKLDQVFQRVSNGKKLLASALLTKGVKISEDATFTEIARAIEKIPSKVVVDSGDTAASIEYDYHYHKDGRGQTCGDAYVSPSRKGGCYETPVYHRHSDSCYATQNKYVIKTKKSTRNICHVKDYSDGTPVYAYECSHCGARYNNTDPYHDETVDSIEEVRERNGKLLDIITKRVMVCGKNENYIEYYAPSCGYVHGQVVSAYIKFKGRNAQYNSSIPAINTSKGLAMQSISTRAMMMPFESIDFDEERIERSLDAIKGYEEPAPDDTEESLPDTSESVNEKEDENETGTDGQNTPKEGSESNAEIVTKVEENTEESEKDKTDETAEITTDIIDKNCSEDESADEGEEEVTAGEDIEEKAENNE